MLKNQCCVCLVVLWQCLLLTQPVCRFYNQLLFQLNGEWATGSLNTHHLLLLAGESEHESEARDVDGSSSVMNLRSGADFRVTANHDSNRRIGRFAVCVWRKVSFYIYAIRYPSSVHAAVTSVLFFSFRMMLSSLSESRMFCRSDHRVFYR